MRQSKLNSPTKHNADGLPAVIYGDEYTPLPEGYFDTASGDGSTPWYGYIGSWLSGVGNIIGSTKDPADINYYSYGNGSSSSSWLWILAIVAVIIVAVFFIKK